MSGIYIHIPFCRQACAYCDFHFSTRLESQPDMVRAMALEIALRADYLSTRELSSIYIGGGTPSLLKAAQIATLFETVNAAFNVARNAEITLEANPDDITPDALAMWRSLGINRLSIGLQSFDDNELRWMNRAHNAMQARDCVKRAQDAGFSNLSIDLIYGSRFQDLRSWERTLSEAVNLCVQHISSYNLTVEARTRLGWQVAHGREKPADETLSSEQFVMMSEFLVSEGFGHYEISNFARPGMEAVHNSSYWLQRPYLGIGPSAHSFNGHSRQWNVRNNHSYMTAVFGGGPFFEKEELTEKDRYNEYVMTRLRTRWGCVLPEMTSLFSTATVSHFVESISAKKDFVQEKGGVYTLNMQGRLRADGIASDLFLV